MLQRIDQSRRRRGTILPLMAVSLVGIVGCVALAIDIGLFAVARTEMQDAVDASVLAGARELNAADLSTNSGTNNKTNAETQARSLVKKNTVFGGQIVDGNIKDFEVGVYRYNGSTGFEAVFGVAPNTAKGESYTAIKMTIEREQPTFFARVFGITEQNIEVHATAVHRPRDIGIILDFSSSMYFSSEWGSGNPDPNFPRFGPWSLHPLGGETALGNANRMQRTTTTFSGGESHPPHNVTYDTRGGPPIVRDFLVKTTTMVPDPMNMAMMIPQDVYTSKAFTYPNTLATYNALDSSVGALTVMPAPNELVDQTWDTTKNFGDKFPLRWGVAGSNPPLPSEYAKNVAELNSNLATPLAAVNKVNTASPTAIASVKQGGGSGAATTGWQGNNGTGALTPWETNGYGTTFAGYTMGPGYYGKTFYMWPPDPRAPAGAWSVSSNSHVGVARPTQHQATTAAANYRPGDWRQRFFVFGENHPITSIRNTPVDRNSALFNTSGVWQAPSATTYRINYNEVLKWILSGPKVFPDNMRCGRIYYYNSIPTGPGSSVTSINQNTWATGTPSDADQLFWRDYINFVLGTNTSILYGKIGSSGAGGTQSNGSLNYGTIRVTPKVFQLSAATLTKGSNVVTGVAAADIPKLAVGQTVLANAQTAVNDAGATQTGTPRIPTPTPASTPITITAITANSITLSAPANWSGSPANPGLWVVDDPSASSTGATSATARYMNYNDNVEHPGIQKWFGPLTLMAFLQNAQGEHFHPGTAHQCQTWQMKVGVQSALADMKVNHPNDVACMIFYARSTNYPTPRVSLGNNYKLMQNALWYPHRINGENSDQYLTDPDKELHYLSSAVTNQTPMNIPRGVGNTNPDSGFKMAFNQFSNNTAAPNGGVGRVGASKMVIFETDGVPNNSAGSDTQAGFQKQGPNKSYYNSNVGDYDSDTDYGNLNTQPKIKTRQTIRNMCMAHPLGTEYANSFSNGGKTARVHAIGFGDLLEPSPYGQPTAAAPLGAKQFLAYVQMEGNTTARSPAPTATSYNNTYNFYSPASALEDYKIITGTPSERITKMEEALRRVMQGDILLSLIE